MIYVINGKYYILVSGYYKEVTVKKTGKEYEVKPVEKSNQTKIEASTMKNKVSVMTVQELLEKNNKSLDNKPLNS